eukprot:2663379-Rhodomonas_salina.3
MLNVYRRKSCLAIARSAACSDSACATCHTSLHQRAHALSSDSLCTYLQREAVSQQDPVCQTVWPFGGAVLEDDGLRVQSTRFLAHHTPQEMSERGTSSAELF